jgi:hypothetical protein
MPVKNLCCNNAGKNARPLRAIYYDLNDITIEFTALHTPQQNGVFERCITVLMQQANAMMMLTNLNEEGCWVLWAKAVNTANTMENITSPSVNPKTA